MVVRGGGRFLMSEVPLYDVTAEVEGLEFRGSLGAPAPREAMRTLVEISHD